MRIYGKYSPQPPDQPELQNESKLRTRQTAGRSKAELSAALARGERWAAAAQMQATLAPGPGEPEVEEISVRVPRPATEDGAGAPPTPRRSACWTRPSLKRRPPSPRPRAGLRRPSRSGPRRRRCGCRHGGFCPSAPCPSVGLTAPAPRHPGAPRPRRHRVKRRARCAGPLRARRPADAARPRRPPARPVRVA